MAEMNTSKIDLFTRSNLLSRYITLWKNFMFEENIRWKDRVGRNCSIIHFRLLSAIQKWKKIVENRNKSSIEKIVAISHYQEKLLLNCVRKLAAMSSQVRNDFESRSKALVFWSFSKQKFVFSKWKFKLECKKKIDSMNADAILTDKHNLLKKSFSQLLRSYYESVKQKFLLEKSKLFHLQYTMYKFINRWRNFVAWKPKGESIVTKSGSLIQKWCLRSSFQRWKKYMSILDTENDELELDSRARYFYLEKTFKQFRCALSFHTILNVRRQVQVQKAQGFAKLSLLLVSWNFWRKFLLRNRQIDSIPISYPKRIISCVSESDISFVVPCINKSSSLNIEDDIDNNSIASDVYTAARLYRRKLLLTCFETLRTCYSRIRYQIWLEKMSKKCYLIRFLFRWKKFKRHPLDVLLRKYNSISVSKIKSRFFETWLQSVLFVKRDKELNILAQGMCLRVTLNKFWRLWFKKCLAKKYLIKSSSILRLKKLKNAIEAFSEFTFMSLFRYKNYLNAVRSFYFTKLKCVFNNWHKRLMQLKLHQNELDTCYANFNKLIVFKCFSCWKLQYCHSANLGRQEDLAVKFYEGNLKNFCFKIIRLWLKSLGQLQAIAIRFQATHNVLVCKRILYAWQKIINSKFALRKSYSGLLVSFRNKADSILKIHVFSKMLQNFRRMKVESDLLKVAMKQRLKWDIKSSLKKWLVFATISKRNCKMIKIFHEKLHQTCVKCIFFKWWQLFRARRVILMKNCKALNYWSVNLQTKFFHAFKNYVITRKKELNLFAVASELRKQKLIKIATVSLLKASDKLHLLKLAPLKEKVSLKAMRTLELVAQIARRWRNWVKEKKFKSINHVVMHSSDNLFRKPPVKFSEYSISLLHKWDVMQEKPRKMPKPFHPDIVPAETQYVASNSLDVQFPLEKVNESALEARLNLLESELTRLYDLREEYRRLKFKLHENESQLSILDKDSKSAMIFWIENAKSSIALYEETKDINDKTVLQLSKEIMEIAKFSNME